jgi:hypothetical protein
MNLHRSFALLIALGLTACSTHQLKFKPYAGIPAEDAAALKRGEYNATPAALFDAAATTLEHEPFLHWSVGTMDKANGFIQADAGLLREVQLRVSTITDAAGATATAAAHSRLEISIPRRPLVTETKVWTKDKSGFQTAYEPEAKEIDQYSVTAVSAELDEAYLRSFVYRVLHDRSQVPFSLQALNEDEPVAIDQAPVTPAPTPVVTPEPTKMPVRDDAGAPAK